jgi:flagellar biosynthesis/type III secretory pathway protein FliH
VRNILPARVLTADHVSRGWTGVNAQERNEIRQEVKQQTRGATPQTAHARPIGAAELKPLPAKVITEGPAVTATTRTPGKGKPLGTGIVPANPAGTNRPAVTTGEAPRKGAAGDHRVVPPETSGVVTRPGVDETVPRVPQNPAVVGKGKTTTPHTPITTVPSTRGADTPMTHVPPTTTSSGKPLKRFDEDDQPRTAPTRPSGVSPVQPAQPIQRVQPTQPLQPTQPIERVAPPTSGGFKRGAVNTPDRPRPVEAPEINRAPKPDYDQIQRQQAAARQQQQQAAAMQQQAIARQQQQAAAQERNRGDDARERAQAQAQASQRQAAAVSAARERAVQVQPQRPPQQAQPQSVPQRPPSNAPAQDSRDKKDKDKDDKKR